MSIVIHLYYVLFSKKNVDKIKLIINARGDVIRNDAVNRSVALHICRYISAQ